MIKPIFLLLAGFLCVVASFSSNIHSRSAISARINVKNSNLYMGDDGIERRKRRTKGKKLSNSDVPVKDESEKMGITPNLGLNRNEINQPLSIPDTSLISKTKSKLPPLSGTLEEKQSKYLEKGVVERTVNELLSTPPAGEEPKLVTAMKNITWVSVLVLVLVEIFVSIKVGGTPFGVGKVNLPPPPPLVEMMSNQ